MLRRAVILALVAALVAPTAAPARPQRTFTHARAVAAPGYWTSDRLEAALPRPLPSTDPPSTEAAPPSTGRAATPPGTVLAVPPLAPTSPSRRPLQPSPRAEADAASSEVTGDLTRYPYSTHGKVFFTDPGSGIDYVCSGTVVTSPGRNLVLTAGHCVYDEGRWMTNWIFVPAYRDGDAPLGMWEAERIFTTPGWSQNGSFRVDIGAALVAAGPGETEVADVTGARGMRWGAPEEPTYVAYGYPAGWPFDGRDLRRCTSGLAGRDGNSPTAPLAIDCDMTGGSSGGGWVVGGYVESVTSYGYDDQPDVLYGPAFGNAAAALYESATGEAPPPAPSKPAPALLSGVRARPDPFTPNGDGVDDRARILFALARDARVTIVIRDADGETVRVLGRGVECAAGKYGAPWNGRDRAGRRAPAGAYRYVVTAGSDTERGRITLRRPA